MRIRICGSETISISSAYRGRRMSPGPSIGNHVSPVLRLLPLPTASTPLRRPNEAGAPKLESGTNRGRRLFTRGGPSVGSARMWAHARYQTVRTRAVIRPLSPHELRQFTRCIQVQSGPRPSRPAGWESFTPGTTPQKPAPWDVADLPVNQRSTTHSFTRSRLVGSGRPISGQAARRNFEPGRESGTTVGGAVPGAIRPQREARMGTMPDTMQPAPLPSVYQLRVVVRGVSPLIWRRLLIPADTTIADLHAVLQVAFGWTGVRGPTGAKTTSGTSRGGLLSSGRARRRSRRAGRASPGILRALWRSGSGSGRGRDELLRPRACRRP